MLYKSVFRHLSRRLFQPFLLGIIIIFSAFIYVVMEYSIGSIKEPTEIYFEQAVQEDFNVMMIEQLLETDLVSNDVRQNIRTITELYRVDHVLFEQVMNHRISRFKEAFPETEIETRLYKDIYVTIDGTQNVIRFLKDAESINLSTITHGIKPSAHDEIALTRIYAELHEIQIGEQISFNDTSFKVTGFVLFPDYSLAMLGNEFILNNETRTLALINDEAFMQLPTQVGIQLAGIFTNLVDTSSYFDQTNTLDFILNISLTKNTIRSGAIYDELAGGQAMGIVMSVIIASMAIFIVSIMVSRMLQEQRGAIGILKALGYKDIEIIRPYMLFVVLLALPGLVIGYVLGLLVSKPLAHFYASIYLLPEPDLNPSMTVFLISIILPLFVLLVLGCFVVSKLLKVHPIALMNPSIKPPKQNKLLSKIKFKNFKLLTRLKHAYVLRNKLRFTVFLTGVSTAVILILMALSMVNMFDKMIKDYYESVDFNYIAYCNPAVGCENELVSYDRAIEIPQVLLNNQSVVAVGLDGSNQYHRLFEDDKEITNLLDEEGIIITKALAMERNLKTGDVATLKYGQNSIEVKILGIQDEYGAAKIYINRSVLSFYITEGQSIDFYNVRYMSETPTANYMQVIIVSDILDQARDFSQLTLVMSYLLVIVSMIIGIVVLMLITILAVEAYYYDISLFKVIGYDNKEIEKVFLSGYRFYSLFVYFIMLPIALVMFDFMVSFFATQYGMIFPMTLTIAQMILAFILTLAIIYLSLIISKRKLKNLSLQQALKIYQN
jgi:putative ABC transport system permease protein